MNGQLALLKRSILTDSRSVGNYLSALAGGIVFFILFLIIGESRNFTGLSYLKTISLTNLFIITITGVVGFSSVITEEKEDDTLGLLLMFGISPTTLIFSKAISRTIRGLYLTLSQLPFVILAIALGGIAINQVIALYVCFASFILFLAFFCAFFSVLCSTTTQAAFLSSFILILTLILTVNVDSTAIYLNPIASIDLVLDIGYKNYLIPEQVITHLGISTLFYFLAVTAFRTIEAQPASEASPGRETFKPQRKGSRAWNLALCWKDFNYNYGGPLWWLWQLIIIFGITMTALSSTRDPDLEDFINVLCIVGTGCLFLQLIFVSQTMMSREFKGLTHTALFTLPSELKDLLIQKVYAGLLFSLPTLLLTLVGTLKLIASEIDAFLGVILMVAAAAFHLTLTFYLSIKIRLFAFLLAGFGTMLYSFLCALLLSSSKGSWEGVSIIMSLFYTAATCFIFMIAFNLLLEKASQN